jgi:hypothetical protein
VLALAWGVGPTHRARASFHLWEIYEVFSNADGSVQYVELGVADDFENEVGGHAIVATSDGVSRTFTFPMDLPHGQTAGRTFLVATPGFATLPGAVTPDYVLPCAPFFDPHASAITIRFVAVDSVAYTGAALPTDGAQSISDQGVAAASSPQNFAGDVGSLSLPACLVERDSSAGDPSDVASCDALRLCTRAACAPAPVCADEVCYDEASECLACTTPAGCDDGNPCTDDPCDTGYCRHAPTTGSCDDGRDHDRRNAHKYSVVLERHRRAVTSRSFRRFLGASPRATRSRRRSTTRGKRSS